MTTYTDTNSDSGILAYEAGADWITVTFHDGGTYLYNYRQPGPGEVEQMKRLAAEGKGLNAYINKAVRNNYARKVR